MSREPALRCYVCNRPALPGDTHPMTKLRVCCDGETIVALADDVAFQPIGGQVVMAFNVPTFGEHVTQTLAMPRVEAVPAPVEGDAAEAAWGEIGDLVGPHRARQRPGMHEQHRLAAAPLPMKQLDAVTHADFR